MDVTHPRIDHAIGTLLDGKGVTSAFGYNKWIVLLGSCSALVVISAAAVVTGAAAGSLVDPKYVKLGSGLLFIAIGLWTLFK